MIKKIVHLADIHIRNLRRYDEYVEQLSKCLESINEEIKDFNKDEVRIVVCGDLFHQKLDISGEAYGLASWFLEQLDKIATTIVIAGNHDMNMANLSRVDPISTVFNMQNFEHTYFLDKELEYESGMMEDDNVIWCLYSSFDNFAQPNLKELDGDKIKVGLFHGDIKGASTDVGYSSENGLPSSYFEGLDVCLCGHVHKRQILTNNGVKLIYSGSLIQQDHGENISGHGYGIWDIETETYKSIDIDNSLYGFYTFQINNEDDIDNDNEKILNI